MKYQIVIFFIALIFIISCKKNEGGIEIENWRKGNLHTHTLWSDGDEFPERVIDWYLNHGYNFLAITDHNTFLSEEKWVIVPDTPGRIEAFENYFHEYGEDWVEQFTDSSGIHVRLKTYQELYNRYREEDHFLLIPGEEISSGFDGKPLHINAINLKEKIVPQKGYSVAEVIQNNVDVVLNQRDSLKLPMFPHINHPNFRYAISKKDFALLNGVRFFEVYNGHPLVNNYGDSIHESTEELWDYVNYIFLGNNKPLMYGFAVDDSHNYHLLGSEFSNAGRGWIMVNSNELTPKSLLDAMDKGNFYATTGVLVNNIVINNEMIKFDILEEENVSYSTEFVGYNKDGTWQLFYKTDHFSPLYKFVGNELFVRARIVSSKEKNNPFQAGDKEMAWLQPIQR